MSAKIHSLLSRTHRHHVAVAWAGTSLALTILSGIVGAFWGFGLRSAGVALGVLWFFFVPGLVASYALFRRSETGIIERVGFALFFSLTVQPVLLFALSRTGVVPVTLWGALLASTILIGIGSIFLFASRRKETTATLQ